MYAKPNGERFRPRSSRESTRCPAVLRCSDRCFVDRSMAASISRSFETLAAGTSVSATRQRDARVSTHVPRVILHLFCYCLSRLRLEKSSCDHKLNPFRCYLARCRSATASLIRFRKLPVRAIAWVRPIRRLLKISQNLKIELTVRRFQHRHCIFSPDSRIFSQQRVNWWLTKSGCQVSHFLDSQLQSKHLTNHDMHCEDEKRHIESNARIRDVRMQV